MTLLKDLKIGDIVLVEENKIVGDIVLVEENKVPAKYILVNKHVEYTTECGTIGYRSILLRVDLANGYNQATGHIYYGYPLLYVSENGTWIDDSGILHEKEKDE